MINPNSDCPLCWNNPRLEGTEVSISSGIGSVLVHPHAQMDGILWSCKNELGVPYELVWKCHQHTKAKVQRSCTRCATVCVRKALTSPGRAHRNLRTVSPSSWRRSRLFMFPFFFILFVILVFTSSKKMNPNQLPAIKNEDSRQKELDFPHVFENWNIRHS